MDSSESTPSVTADSAAWAGSGKGAVLLLVIFCGGSGMLNRGFTRPLLDLVTRVGVALEVGRGGSLPPAVLRLPDCMPPLQVCLRAEVAEEGGCAAPLRGVGGREIEYDL